MLSGIMYPESNLISLSPLSPPGRSDHACSLRPPGYLPTGPSASTLAFYGWKPCLFKSVNQIKTPSGLQASNSFHHNQNKLQTPPGFIIWRLPPSLTSLLLTPPGSNHSGCFLSLEQVRHISTPGPLHWSCLWLEFSLLRSLHGCRHQDLVQISLPR